MHGRIAIDNINPTIDGGVYPAKAVVGEHIPFHAVIWMEGHDFVGGRIIIRQISSTPLESIENPNVSSSSSSLDSQKTFVLNLHALPEPDHFLTFFSPNNPGLWSFSIEAYRDIFANWRDGLHKKLMAGFTAEQLHNELEQGEQLFRSAAKNYAQYQEKDREYSDYIPSDLSWEEDMLRYCESSAQALINPQLELSERTKKALSPEIQSFFHRYPLCDLITISPEHLLWVDRKQAQFSAWYEFFPRSTGGWDKAKHPIHGTFATAATELTRIARLGFDTVYLPPIHPIGFIHRKGKNNHLKAEKDDVGSPWAIGSPAGGHTEIHPALGTIADFASFMTQAQNLKLEIALDFALQCSPDHPWVTKHPEWFTILPDGSIACAENPPKIYQDIYPLNFDKDPEGLYQAALEILLYWISQGVKIFRVDNPHTKPPNFWEWLIAKVKSEYPEVLFLSESFTRPSRLYGLAQRGFSQSYTYFTWRNTKYELIEFMREILQHSAESRPNFFTNTPDILHASLQYGGPAMFAIRATLAATLSPSWGIYSGFELYENQALGPDSEEYKDSEKYQLRPRNYYEAVGAGKSLEPWISQLNHIRRHNPALQQLCNIAFHTIRNDQLLAYSKYDIETGNNLLIIVNLDPLQAQEGIIELNLPLLGQPWDGRFEVIDTVDGSRYWWGQYNFIRLQPWLAVCHIFILPLIDKIRREEIGRKYYIESHTESF